MKLRSSSARQAFSTAALLLILLMPAGLLFVAAQSFPTVPTELALSSETVLITPTEVVEQAESRGVVNVMFGSTPVVVAPDWEQEVITSIEIRVGDVLPDGQRIATIGEIPIYGYSTPRPFSRDLGQGDDGDDVAMLQELLNREGFPTDVDGSFRTGTGRAVKAWRESRGVVDADSGFVASEVVWIPPDFGEIVDNKLAVGRLAPSAGEEVLVGSRMAQQVTVTETDGPFSAPAQGDLVVELPNQRSVPIEEFQPGRNSEVIDVVVEAWLQTQEDTPAIPDQIEVAVVLRERAQTTRLALPGSAVVTDEIGRTCVLVSDGEDDEPVPARVEIAGGSLDVVQVWPGRITLTDLIVVNPLEAVNRGTSCP